ncbi:MAG: hypothetical protein FJ125_18655, partial [Deltaproteobacteria bacterium]|nr:hypothetical protein [Deltaproteobacteria bacterium]
MSELVCCIDIGTTRLKVAAFDEELQLVALESSGTIAGPAARPYELDLVALPALAGETLRGLLAHPAVAGRSIAGLSVTGQRATVAELHGNGSPAGPALSWQDGRGHAALELLLARFGRGEFSSITGLPPSALWSISKILWLQEQRGASLEHDRRLALLPDFLLGWLGAEGLVTDLSSASLTGLLDLGTLRWCGRLLDELGLVEEQLPQLLPAGARIGRLGVEAARHTGLMAGTPLYLGGGDQQCAALGLGAVEPGEVALCLGTAAVVSCPVDRPVLDPSGRTFCTAHVVPGRWVLEGIHNAFGSSLGWVQAMLGLGSAAELLELAEVAVAAPATPDGSVL